VGIRRDGSFREGRVEAGEDGGEEIWGDRECPGREAEGTQWVRHDETEGFQRLARGI
jgi:hypothetical protein